MRIKVGTNILGQMFINNTGFNADVQNNDHDPTLYITGGLTGSNGEYARPISLHGKYINLFAQDSNKTNLEKNTSDANLNLQTGSFETKIGESTIKLFRDENNEQSSNLMSANNLKLNAGLQSEGKKEEYYEVTNGNNIITVNKKNYPESSWFIK